MGNFNRLLLNRRTALKAMGLGSLAALPGVGIRDLAFAADAKTLVWARPNETIVFDPQASSLGSSWQLQHLVYESLFTVDEHLNVIPALGESWKWDGDTLIITIREGVKFANGREMTVDDVTKSLGRMFASGSPWGLLLRNHKAVQKQDERTLSIVFDGPNAAAVYALAASLASILPMKEFEDGSFNPAKEMMMGTGPFYVESHVANDHWLFKRNEHYWQKGKPKIEKLEIRTVPTPQGLIAALRDGSADIVSFGDNPDATDLLAGVADIKIINQKSTSYFFLLLNAVAKDSIFKDKRVRQAVALTLDRAQLNKLALGGQATETTGFTQFGLKDADLPFTHPDIARAKALIAEAKPAKTSFDLVVAASNLNSQMAEVIKQQLVQIGLQANIQVVEEGVWAKRTWGSNPTELDATITYYAGFNNPLITMHWWAPELAGFTAGHVAPDADYTAAVNAALVARPGDEAERLQKLAHMINEAANKIPLVTRDVTVAVRTDKVSAQISTFESQENILSGVENFEVKG
jgi:peptide/nickel transport system substrate-binding protein